MIGTHSGRLVAALRRQRNVFETDFPARECVMEWKEITSKPFTRKPSVFFSLRLTFHFGWLLCSTIIPGAAADLTAHQGTGYHHTGWNGLGAVFDLKQSPEGYLWLTTSKGVLRFDGVRFQSVEEVTRGAVHDSEVDSVFLSSSGGLWLTTQGAGLLFWKDGHLTTFPDRRCTPTRKQGKIVEVEDGSLWVQASAGLFHLRGSVCEQAGVEQGYPGGFAAGILVDSDGTLWIKRRSGPLLFLPTGQSEFQVSRYGEGTSTSYGKERRPATLSCMRRRMARSGSRMTRGSAGWQVS